MSRFKLDKKPDGVMGFKIESFHNGRSITISFAADDSCGAFRNHYGRESILVWYNDTGEEIYEIRRATPEDLLHVMQVYMHPLTIESVSGLHQGTCYLSDEVYVVVNRLPGALEVGDRVRLISGIHGSPIPGYHFALGMVTVCPVNAKYADHIGVRRSDLRLVAGE